MLKALQLTR